MGLRKERQVLNLKNIFFATFAKNLCVFALKKLLRQPHFLSKIHVITNIVFHTKT